MMELFRENSERLQAVIYFRKFFSSQMVDRVLYELKYSRVDQVNFLKAVFHKIYLFHSWILCP